MFKKLPKISGVSEKILDRYSKLINILYSSGNKGKKRLFPQKTAAMPLYNANYERGKDMKC